MSEVVVRRQDALCEIALARAERKNTLTAAVLAELHRALDEAEAAGCKIAVLSGEGGHFCTGMDLEASTQAAGGEAAEYMRLLKRLSGSRLITLAKIDGTVMAGGVGLAAACDLAIASPKATFALSEALWGLLPAMVTPYLIRRVGFQKAYAMTLTTRTVTAEEALAMGLVDELSPDSDAAVRAQAQRLKRLHPDTVGDLKAYFRKMWIVTDEMERVATAELERLVAEPRVRKNIRDYVELGRLPWERW